MFEVPTGQKATMLHYDDKQGRQASAPVPAVPSALSVCEQYVAMADKAAQDPQGPCEQCLVQAQQSGPCVDATSTANSTCGTSNCSNNCAADAGADPASDCSCYKACVSPACWSAGNDILTCLTTACASSC